VVAIDGAGGVTAEQHLSPSAAHFRFSVRPGNYVVELLADGKHVHDRLLQAKGDTVAPRHRSTVVFAFNVP
jgi:hypothetical protein